MEAHELPRPTDRPYGEGIYRRRIMLRLNADGSAAGELEDDFHNFRVDLTHADGVVTTIDGKSIRGPWTMCLTAGEPIQDVVGTPLKTGPTTLRHLDARVNCTHMFDLTGLLIAHAARGVPGDRAYDMAVTDDRDDQSQRATLARDGVDLLEWIVRGRELLEPADWRDVPLWNGFIDWAGENLDDDDAEAAVALRRACDISIGRRQDLDSFPTAADLTPEPVTICHAIRPGNASVAFRRKRSDRDYTDHTHLMARDLG